MAYLESQNLHSSKTVEANKQLRAEIQAHKSKIDHLELQIEQTRQSASAAPPEVDVRYQRKPQQMPVNMSSWLPVEKNLYNEWSSKSGKRPLKSTTKIKNSKVSS